MIGKTVFQYKFLEKLGEGGMDVVYKAEDTKLDRVITLKFLPSNLIKDLGAKKRFVHGACAASANNHENICTVYKVDEGDEDQRILNSFHHLIKIIKEHFI